MDIADEPHHDRADYTSAASERENLFCDAGAVRTQHHGIASAGRSSFRFWRGQMTVSLPYILFPEARSASANLMCDNTLRGPHRRKSQNTAWIRASVWNGYCIRSTRANEVGVLGEIQFAFICFLTGQVYDGFEQWKKLVALLCSCDEALAKHPHLYEQFITVLHYHLAEVPEDFLRWYRVEGQFPYF